MIFRKHLRLALVLMAASGSFGNVVFAQLFHYTIEVYGWRGSMLICGAGGALQLLVGAAIVRQRHTDGDMFWVCTRGAPVHILQRSRTKPAAHQHSLNSSIGV
jgi:hypothetical protein